MSFSFFNSFNGNSQRLGQKYSIVSPDINPPAAPTYIGADTSSVTFSFTAPKTGGTISGYTAYVNGKPYSGTGGPSSYTITGLSQGGQYRINMVANIVSTSSTSTTTTSAFTPTSISSCALWFDAADSSTITKSGTAVSQWLDKSVNGYSVIQSTSGNQPTYVANSLNGYGGIQLSSSSYLYQLGSNIPNFSSSSATSVFFVVKVDSSLATSGWNLLNSMSFIGPTTGGTMRYQISFAQGTSLGFNLRVGNPNELVVGTASAVAFGSNALVGFTISSSGAIITVNGTSTSYTGYSLQSANNATLFLIGDQRGVHVKDEIIYEMVGFNTQLSTNDQQKVEGYLAWKWGIQTNLPSGHPYYSSNGYITSSTVTTTNTKNILSNPSTPLVLSTLAPFPTNITLISSTTTSLTFSFTAPTTGSTPSDYTPYINSVAGTGSGGPSSYTISGLSAGTAYSVTMAANVTTTNTFNPISISGTLLWLDSADTSTITYSSGSNISQWSDKSGLNYNFTQPTGANQPTYVTMTNGKPALNLTNSGVMFNNNVPVSTTYTIFAVGYSGASNFARLINNDNHLLLGGINGKLAAVVGTDSGWSSTTAASPSTSITNLCLMEMTNANNIISPYVNGTALNTTNLASSSFTGLSIGAVFYSGSYTQFWGGYVSEVLIYNSVLSTTDRQKVEGYLAWKWSIQTSLPTGHPYYSTNNYNSTTTTIYQNPSPVSLSTQ